VREARSANGILAWAGRPKSRFRRACNAEGARDIAPCISAPAIGGSLQHRALILARYNSDLGGSPILRGVHTSASLLSRAVDTARVATGTRVMDVNIGYAGIRQQPLDGFVDIPAFNHLGCH
jgi:hypothetical protein